MDIPGFLKERVREGKVVLVLGAGASREATDSKGNRPPTAGQLGAMLSDKFLGGRYRQYGLAQIAELAISESDLVTVQEYIRDVFEPFEPCATHRLMTAFVWSGLATTNYDRIIEKAYATPQAIQRVVPFVRNGDRVEEAMRDRKAIMLLKLHGCITRTSDLECPLILTPDQYIQYRKGRTRIFDHLTDWGFELPLVFVGHSLQDADLRALILQLTQECGEGRPRYYAVAPDSDDVHARLWEAKKVTLLRGTFEDFLGSLDVAFPRALRKLATVADEKSLAIAERFTRADWAVSPACQQFLQTDVEYVSAAVATESVAPKDFYRGFNPGWSAVDQNLDAPRKLTDTILSDHFLADDSEHFDRMELVLVKAHAGAGKSVLLRRLAWDASHEYNCICLFAHPRGVIDIAAIQELLALCSQRIYLFVDDAADRVRELRDLADNVGREGRLLTVVVAERTNEWNIACGELVPLVTSEYELRYLSSSEIDSVLGLLERHRALGTLEHLGLEERRRAFEERAGRQLLVALHEATLGRPFEDIIEDEFRHVEPDEARRIYLTICVLNRLNVSVRAGVVSRIHGVPFDDFRKRLFSPLEHVVHARYDQRVRDYVYEARHSHIADIVFHRILMNPEERYDAYLRCLRALNIDYSDDRSAYRQMIRGRTLLDLFPNHEHVTGIYAAARSSDGEDAYLLHQMAIYEMHRPNGNLHESAELLDRALKLAPSDPSIRHSVAERYLRSADDARTPLERAQLLSKAGAVAEALKRDCKDRPHPYHTILKVGLARLEDLLAQTDGVSHAEIAERIGRVERDLHDARQRFPDEPYILEAEARLGALTADAPRVRGALRQAFDANPRSTYLATRLAQCYRESGDLNEAKETLEAALNANRGEKRLHYAYAKLLIDMGNTDGDLLVYHLRRAFTAGDTNYDAQLLYGRQLYINREFEESGRVFRDLQAARVDPALRNVLRHPVNASFHGQVVRKEATYCFVIRDGSNDRIFAHISNIDSPMWQSLAVGSRVAFQIGFAFRGAGAFDVAPE